jgi:type 1 fimbria pilin
MKPTWAVTHIALALSLIWAASAAAIPDHLKCYKVKDSQAKASYTANVEGLTVEAGCTVKVPGKLLCVAAEKSNVTPAPPGGGGTGQPNNFICYKLKCPKGTLPPVAVSDQFGTRTVTPGTPKLLCAPVAPPTTTTTGPPTTTTTTSSTTTTSMPGVVLQGSLPATTGRFNYNLVLGLPGANSACNTNFPGTHACTYANLQAAEAAGDLDGLKDTNNMTVTSFWAIDSSQPGIQQCIDDALGGSNLNWEYGTAHTPSRGQRVTLNNPAGTLGALQSSVQCNISGTSWVGCCL